MNKAFKLIPTFLKCASSRSSFGRSLLFNEKKNEPPRHAVHSAKYSKSAAGRAEDSIHIAKGYGNHFSFDGLACNPILLNIWQHTPSPLPSNTSRQYHNGRHKQPSCPLTSWSRKKKPKAQVSELHCFKRHSLRRFEVGEHLCLLKSKSNTPPWHFSLLLFLLPQHSAVAWLKQMPLTFHYVINLSGRELWFRGGHGVPGGCSVTLPDDSGKKELRRRSDRERMADKRGAGRAGVSDKWKTTDV